MATTKPLQAADAAVTWTVDWTKQLAAAGTGITLTDATVTCATTGVVIGGVTATDTAVTFRLSTLDGFTGTPLFVPVVVDVDLSNGDVDTRTVYFQLI